MKEYIKPEMETFKGEAETLLAGSVPVNDDIPADGTQPIYAPMANDLLKDDDLDVE